MDKEDSISIPPPPPRAMACRDADGQFRSDCRFGAIPCKVAALFGQGGFRGTPWIRKIRSPLSKIRS